MRDIYHNIAVTQPLSPVVSTTAKTSETIDLRGFGAANIVFAVGASSDTLSGSVYWTLKLTHSDNDTDYSDVAASELSNGVAVVLVNSASVDEKAYGFGYVGEKRYLRAVATPTGSHSSGTPIGVVALRGAAGYKPVI